MAATDPTALIRTASANQASKSTLLTGLTPGTNTFTLQYKTEGGSVDFANREIFVIPLN